MTADIVWKGNYDKHIYVFKNKYGNLEFFPLYELNKIEDHLFFNTKLDVAKNLKSTFGKFYKENGEHFIKLNLQIKFC
ncbi:MAG: HpaII family restriction endonuclease [Ignavibacteria bacterium]|nr:HpaII family restriction endonuclease [Ignavibacteria bacterium]